MNAIIWIRESWIGRRNRGIIYGKDEWRKYGNKRKRNGGGIEWKEKEKKRGKCEDERKRIGGSMEM